jgi:hypothetical protein
MKTTLALHAFGVCAAIATTTVAAPASASPTGPMARAGASHPSIVVKFRAQKNAGELAGVSRDIASVGASPQGTHLDPLFPATRSAPAPARPGHQRLFPPSRPRGQANEGQGLDRYYRLPLPVEKRGDTSHINALLSRLAARDDVETAYADVEPAGLEQHAKPDATGPAASTPPSGEPPAVVTPPDLAYMQFYLYGPDETKDGYKLGGLNVQYAHRFPGARGEGITLVSKEVGGWYADHADLPAPVRRFGDFVASGPGTRSAGIMAAIENGYGVTGIANRASLAYAAAGIGNLAELRDYLKPGDVLQIGMQVDLGPVAGCRSSCFVPMEALPAWYDAIKELTDRGIVVVEAAGNGNVDLDHPDFDGRFDRKRRDSGAVMVGSICARNAVRAPFSNHGTRVDAAGWGCWDAATTTSGAEDADLWSEFDNWYTSGVASPASANPIVAAAAASLSGYARVKGATLGSTDVRVLLNATGTPLDGAATRIGTQPDLKKAFAEVDDCLSARVPE